MSGIAAAQDGGTHFIAEASVGAAAPLGLDTERVGFGVGVTAGFGGKTPGAPLRLYAIGSLEYAQFSVRRVEGTALQRSLWEMSGGGRVLFPLTPHVRLFVDGLLGLAWLEAEELMRSGEYVTIVDEAPRLMVSTGLGVQFRPLLQFSIGGRASFGWILDDSDLPEEEIEGRVLLVGTATLHF